MDSQKNVLNVKTACHNSSVLRQQQWLQTDSSTVQLNQMQAKIEFSITAVTQLISNLTNLPLLRPPAPFLFVRRNKHFINICIQQTQKIYHIKAWRCWSDSLYQQCLQTKVVIVASKKYQTKWHLHRQTFYIYTHTHTYIYCMYIHIYIYMCMYIYIYIYIYICVYACMYVCMYVYIHVYVCFKYDYNSNLTIFRELISLQIMYLNI